jgi:hypothetical protein
MTVASPAPLTASDERMGAPSTRTTLPVDAGSDARWAAWVERGRQHDLALRRKVRFAIAVAVIIALLTVLIRLFGDVL